MARASDNNMDLSARSVGDVRPDSADIKGERPLSQWHLIVRRFKKHQLAKICLWILGIFIVLAVFAEFLVPYSPFEQFGGKVYVPPVPIHFIDEEGQFHLRPFVYGYQQKLDLETFERNWSANKDKQYPIYFLVRGFDYKLLGLIPTDLHLFGISPAAPPFFIFGSDNLGRDTFSRTIYATRISLSIAFLGVIVSVILSILIGGVAGYYGGIMDELVQRLSEVLLSVPTLPLWMGLAAAVPASWPVVKVYIALVIIISFISWPWMARGIRSKLISLRKEDYVQAAVSYAASDARIIFIHLVPNFASYIIVSVTLAIPGMILLETALSFLGLGLRSPAVSWGVLLEQGLTLVETTRKRHDGVRRNPWDEVECGHHYARSMSSWAVLLALSGVHCDVSRGKLSFHPVTAASADATIFRTFWSTGRAWGTYTQRKDATSGVWQPSVEVLGGDVTGLQVTACGQEFTAEIRDVS